MILLVGLAVLSCSESNNESPDFSTFGFDYIPLDLGSEWVYEMDSIVYDPEPSGIVIDTIRQQVKHQVVDVDSFEDGRFTYKIERFLRGSDTSPWEINDVWLLEKNNESFISTEENLSFIKLMFPLKANSSWDGNSRINTDDVRVKVRGESLDYFKFWRNYTVVSFGDTATVGQLFFDDVVEVEQVSKEILIERRYSTESYAKNVGLISKHLEILDTQNDDLSIPFAERAERGFILKLRLISYK